MKGFNSRIRLLLIMDSYYLLAGAMLGPIYALFVDEIGGDLLDASFTFFIYNMASGFTSLFFSKYADTSKHPEKIVAMGRLLVGLGYIAYIFVANTTQLFLVQILIGVGVASAAPAYDGIFTVAADKHKESREWGAWESMYYFTSAFGAVIGGFVVTIFGFDIMFLIMALLMMVTIPLALSIPKARL